jgi:hypothetical protein
VTDTIGIGAALEIACRDPLEIGPAHIAAARALISPFQRPCGARNVAAATSDACLESESCELPHTMLSRSSIPDAASSVSFRDNRPFCDGHHIRCVPTRIV